MKWIVGTLAFLFGPALLLAFFIGYVAQAWGPFWIGQQGDTLALGVEGVDIGNLPLAPVLGPHPIVSDRDRYQLALAAGFSPDEAITATAISIAEDGGGDPAALSAPNRDGSRDFCLMQVNSGWWPRFGGMQALADPLTCFRAARTIYGIQGWCAWSTYDARCGPGHTGSYGANLSRARSAALP